MFVKVRRTQLAYSPVRDKSINEYLVKNEFIKKSVMHIGDFYYIISIKSSIPFYG